MISRLELESALEEARAVQHLAECRAESAEKPLSAIHYQESSDLFDELQSSGQSEIATTLISTLSDAWELKGLLGPDGYMILIASSESITQVLVPITNQRYDDICSNPANSEIEIAMQINAEFTKIFNALFATVLNDPRLIPYLIGKEEKVTELTRRLVGSSVKGLLIPAALSIHNDM
jgi:hypothetical protein